MANAHNSTNKGQSITIDLGKMFAGYAQSLTCTVSDRLTRPRPSRARPRGSIAAPAPSPGCSGSFRQDSTNQAHLHEQAPHLGNDDHLIAELLRDAVEVGHVTPDVHDIKKNMRFPPQL